MVGQGGGRKFLDFYRDFLRWVVHHPAAHGRLGGGGGGGLVDELVRLDQLGRVARAL